MSGRVVGTLVKIRTRAPAACLTFDDGPHPEFTPRILDVLERHGARGTFFMIGKNAEAHPDLVERVAGGGHAVGNHTWSHAIMPSLDGRSRRRELERCAAALEPHGAALFRPPKTLQSLASFTTARLLGYEIVAWNVEVGDWHGPDAETMARRLLERIHPGSIVVLHDALWDPSSRETADRTPLVEALEMTLAQLTSRMELVTVPELLRRGEAVRLPWFVPSEEDWAS